MHCISVIIIQIIITSIIVIFPMVQKPLVGQGLLFIEISRHRHASVDRTPLDEWSARNRDL